MNITPSKIVRPANTANNSPPQTNTQSITATMSNLRIGGDVVQPIANQNNSVPVAQSNGTANNVTQTNFGGIAGSEIGRGRFYRIAHRRNPIHARN